MVQTRKCKLFIITFTLTLKNAPYLIFLSCFVRVFLQSLKKILYRKYDLHKLQCERKKLQKDTIQNYISIKCENYTNLNTNKRDEHL
jgi:hypothetical protein